MNIKIILIVIIGTAAKVNYAAAPSSKPKGDSDKRKKEKLHTSSLLEIPSKDKALFDSLRDSVQSKEQKELSRAAIIIASEKVPAHIKKKILAFLPDFRWLFIPIICFKKTDVFSRFLRTHDLLPGIKHIHWRPLGKTLIFKCDNPGMQTQFTGGCNQNGRLVMTTAADSRETANSTNMNHPHGLCNAAIGFGHQVTITSPDAAHPIAILKTDWFLGLECPENIAWNPQGTCLAAGASRKLWFWKPGVTKEDFEKRMIIGSMQHATLIQSPQDSVQKKDSGSCVIS